MMTLRRLAMGLALSASLLVTQTSFAQVSATDAAQAEKLFQDGRALMAQRKFADACAKLAESQRLDPGVGTLLNLAECFEKNGQVASAWATYREADAAATREGQKKRTVYAAARVKALTPELSYLTVEAPAVVPAGLNVTCDGKPIGAASMGSPMPFDAGSHRLEATAPGRRTWWKSVDLSPKSSLRVSVPDLEVIEVPPPPPEPARPPPAAVIVPVEPPVPEAPPASSTQRVTGVVLGAVGIVGIWVGSYFGIRAKGTHDDAENNHCSAVSCDPTGGSLIDEARGQATISTLAFAAGATMLVAGAILYFTAPAGAAKGAKASRRAGPDLVYRF